ncbi:IclR family transcriptional regulator [Pseudonocardia spinosispora]|uniref:IclR family transcriptional regulator n=1 Tax=Pseudonocardia spinosispora TaxID=103441 RepID=UPI000414E82A|nr:IclR family transcriptional regulator [Pseudonocardia spinosispora]
MNNKRSPGASADGSGTQVQSVDRALTILEYLAEHGSAGVTEIAQSLDVHKSTAFRLVVALENRQLVEQVEQRGKYRLGFGLIRLAGATSAQLDLTKEGRPVCVRLAGEFGETVNIAILDSGSATNITQEHGDTMVTTRNWVGKRTPLHATSSGKVLLAWADAGDIADAVAKDAERFTERTIIGEALRTELKQVRAQGWASCAEELELGLNSVAAPIRGMNGEVVAAVSVSGPSYRMTADDFPEVARRLSVGAAEISTRMGHYPGALS